MDDKARLRIQVVDARSSAAVLELAVIGGGTLEQWVCF